MGVLDRTLAVVPAQRLWNVRASERTPCLKACRHRSRARCAAATPLVRQAQWINHWSSRATPTWRSKAGGSLNISTSGKVYGGSTLAKSALASCTSPGRLDALRAVDIAHEAPAIEPVSGRVPPAHRACPAGRANGPAKTPGFVVHRIVALRMLSGIAGYSLRVITWRGNGFLEEVQAQGEDDTSQIPSIAITCKVTSSRSVIRWSPRPGRGSAALRDGPGCPPPPGSQLTVPSRFGTVTRTMGSWSWLLSSSLPRPWAAGYRCCPGGKSAARMGIETNRATHRRAQRRPGF